MRRHALIFLLLHHRLLSSALFFCVFHIFCLAGINSFLVFMAYKDLYQMSDTQVQATASLSNVLFSCSLFLWNSMEEQRLIDRQFLSISVLCLSAAVWGLVMPEGSGSCGVGTCRERRPHCTGECVCVWLHMGMCVLGCTGVCVRVWLHRWLCVLGFTDDCVCWVVPLSVGKWG